MLLRLIILLCLPLTSWAAITAPLQPASGAGGKKYAYSTISVTVVPGGKQGAAVFYPLGTKAGEQLPLILFFHGWSAVNPGIYGGWITHLARQGNVVVYPYYQDSLLTPPAEMTSNAQEGIRSALAWLQGPAPIGVNTAQTAVVGHSMGGIIGVNYAALAQAHNLPVPKAVLAVQPGKTWGDDARRTIPLADLNTLNPNSLLVTMVGGADRLTADTDARKIYSNAGGLPKSHKRVLLVPSQARGKLKLPANHTAPAAAAPTKATARVMEKGQGAPELLDAKRLATAVAQGGEANALDFYAYWKTFDMLKEAGFKGENFTTLSKNKNWLSLGQYSDKRQLTPLKTILP